MSKDILIEKFNELKNISKQIDIQKTLLEQLDNELTIKTLEYRIKSVEIVLNYINDKCWKNEEIKNLQTLIVHCSNKLNGNIDGIELNLENEEK